jgi:ABC-type glycerol-3-phosphate transport system substrate-binding protein
MRIVPTQFMTSVLLALTLVLGAASAQDPLVVVASESQAPFFQFVADMFEEQVGYPVQIVSQAYDQTHEVIVTAAAGGSTSFDLPVIDTVYVASYAAIGIVEPLDAYAPQEFFDQHTESSMDMMTYQGVPYALGGGYNYKYFFYNQRMLEAAGFSEPPATWDELIEMSKVMQEMGVAAYPLAWGWSQAEGLICDYTLLLNAFGGVYQDESGAWTVDTEAARAARTSSKMPASGSSPATRSTARSARRPVAAAVPPSCRRRRRRTWPGSSSSCTRRPRPRCGSSTR